MIAAPAATSVLQEPPLQGLFSASLADKPPGYAQEGHSPASFSQLARPVARTAPVPLTGLYSKVR